MGTDVERIVISLKNIHESWASILEVGVAIWLLERQVWVACVVPIVICLGKILSRTNQCIPRLMTLYTSLCVRHDTDVESIRKRSEAMD
jgi:hypothetical protein